jgi:hypothetical protein
VKYGVDQFFDIHDPSSRSFDCRIRNGLSGSSLTPLSPDPGEGVKSPAT